KDLCKMATSTLLNSDRTQRERRGRQKHSKVARHTTKSSPAAAGTTNPPSSVTTIWLTGGSQLDATQQRLSFTNTVLLRKLSTGRSGCNIVVRRVFENLLGFTSDKLFTR